MESMNREAADKFREVKSCANLRSTKTFTTESLNKNEDEKGGDSQSLEPMVERSSTNGNPAAVSFDKIDSVADAISQTKSGQIETLSPDDCSKGTNTNDSPELMKEEKYVTQVEADSRSIFVGNISVEVTPEIIEAHFQSCGTPKRITLLYDKNTGVPKGYAYVEFQDQLAREKALNCDGTELRGSSINVYRKRTNIPGYKRNAPSKRQDFYYQRQWNLPNDGGLQNFRDLTFYQVPYLSSINDQISNGKHFNQKYDRPKGSHRGNRRRKQQRNWNKASSNEENHALDPEKQSEQEDQTLSDTKVNQNTTANN